MNQRDRIALLREALAALEPVELEVVDDSHRHRHHAGAADGRGHFQVRIVSDRFANLSRLQRHRLVFETVGDLMKTDVHALQVVALTPAERS